MHKNEAWVLFQKPNEKKKYLLQPGIGESEFSMTSFQGNQHLVIKGTLRQFEKEESTLEWLNGTEFLSSTSEQDHQQGVQSAVEQIISGQLQKIVLSKIEQVPHQKMDLISLFNTLCEAYPSAFNYVCFHPDAGVWSGATPELLLKKTNNKYTTVALAGTRNNDGNSSWTEKEYHEQRIVKEYIEAELEKSGIKKLEIDDLTEAQNGHLLHLKNVIHFEYGGAPKDILKVLHPTPAVCGTPKTVALEIIASLEKHDRRFYSGYLGLKTPDSEAFFVNLRCMQVNERNSLLYAGGGITASSDPKKEWEELLSKSKILKDVILGLQNKTHVQR